MKGAPTPSLDLDLGPLASIGVLHSRLGTHDGQLPRLRVATPDTLDDRNGNDGSEA